MSHDAEKKQAWASLEKEIRDGIDSGEPIDVTEAYWGQKKLKLIAKYPEAATRDWRTIFDD